MVRSEWRAQEGNLSVKGRRTTAGEGYEVAGFSFSRVSQETRHLDREEKGSGATNANSFNSVRESAVRGKEAREVVDEFDNGRERGEGF